ncbi:MAG: hypothetical protein ACNI3C_11555 [Candidatus Marinarcus sp.]|uniref:hypothetical protein n=1 Tax=Candidatus Marinarcus sp. TaxID=3100987 RepID=UPI003AFFB9F2
MKIKSKEPFNPDNFFSSQCVEDVARKFEILKTLDYRKISLANEITKYNYEIVSKDYVDFEFSNIEEYYNFEVDTIV